MVPEGVILLKESKAKSLDSELCLNGEKSLRNSDDS